MSCVRNDTVNLKFIEIEREWVIVKMYENWNKKLLVMNTFNNEDAEKNTCTSQFTIISEISQGFLFCFLFLCFLNQKSFPCTAWE